MSYLVISLVALLVSALTFFSGFGLGTMLMPAFALFFPVTIAVAATAVVHLANNFFKAGLIGRKADRSTVLRFALPAAAAAIIGASLLILFEYLPPIYEYQIGERTFQVTAVKLIIGILIVFFALFDLIPRFSKIAFDKKYLPLGGIFSGFFGGLSGNQGALRSAFLIKAGLDKEAFIATGVVAAIIVDISRLLVYGVTFYSNRFAIINSEIWGLVLAATLAAFIGAYLGRRLLHKVTLRAVQVLVGVLLILVGAGLAAGIL